MYVCINCITLTRFIFAHRVLNFFSRFILRLFNWKQTFHLHKLATKQHTQQKYIIYIHAHARTFNLLTYTGGVYYTQTTQQMLFQQYYTHLSLSMCVCAGGWVSAWLSIYIIRVELYIFKWNIYIYKILIYNVSCPHYYIHI